MSLWTVVISALWVAFFAFIVGFSRVGSPATWPEMKIQADAASMQKYLQGKAAGPDGDKIFQSLKLDAFFIPTYTFLGLTQLAFLLTRPGLPEVQKWICYVLIVLAIVTAGLDVGENLSIPRAIHGNLAAAGYVLKVQVPKVVIPITVDFGALIMIVIHLIRSR